ncbi:glycosyltransferase [uncultured Desulfosarcina sp.]|uniref:glycosyltransferase n=1 Tax=uncultured Desulfosarcina sp. TaxID=218289 RepID=UPI0029C684BB|nr:glycosyltransferase [uncultured Desulfosarcina sp.]
MIETPEKILFVVDSCCFPVRDGSSERYLEWLNYFNLYGYKLFFLSFDHLNNNWSQPARFQLKKFSENFLIIKNHSCKSQILFSVAGKYISRIFKNKIFSHSVFEKTIHKQNHSKIYDYIFDNDISMIIVNKITSALLMGINRIDTQKIPKIIDIHDIHSDHYHHIQNIVKRCSLSDCITGPYSGALSKKLLTMVKPLDYNTMKNEELAILSLFDKILVTSTSEKDHLTQIKRISHKIRYLNPVFSTALPTRSMNTDTCNFDFGFIGSRSIFNIEGLIFFKNEILPRLKSANLAFSCLIAGSVCAAAKKIFSSEKNFQHVEYVHKIEHFYKSVNSVFIPLLSGSGISIKMLEALGHGRSVISTTVGARGLELIPEQDVIIEDDPRAFAKGMIRLLNNRSLRSKLSTNALNTIATKYGLDTYHKNLHAIL